MSVKELEDCVVRDGVYLIDEKEDSIDFAKQSESTRSGGSWPRLSDAIGVHPSQIKEQMAIDKKLGVRIEYTKDGRAVVESQAHQRQIRRAYKLKDKGDYFA
jgi:hypothetical protein